MRPLDLQQGPDRSGVLLESAVGLKRLRSDDYSSLQHSCLVRHVIVGVAPVHQAAIIPHHKIALLPCVIVPELGLDRMFHQLFDQCIAVFTRHVDDLVDMSSNVERLGTGIWMCADQRVSDRWAFPFLCFSCRRFTDIFAVCFPTVHDFQSVDPRLHIGR